MKTTLRSIGGWFLFVAARAHAQAPQPPPLPCGNLPGCGGGTGVPEASPLSTQILPQVVQMMIKVAAGFAVIYIIIAGYQMLTANGDPGKHTKAKWAIIFSLMGLSLAVLSQVIVSGVISEAVQIQFTDEVSILSLVRQYLLLAMDAVFLIVIMIGGIRMLVAQGRPDEFKTASSMITWAIIGAVVINLANLVVQVVASFLGV